MFTFPRRRLPAPPRRYPAVVMPTRSPRRRILQVMRGPFTGRAYGVRVMNRGYAPPRQASPPRLAPRSLASIRAIFGQPAPPRSATPNPKKRKRSPTRTPSPRKRSRLF